MTSGVGASTPSMRGNGASTSVGGATGCSRITAGLPGLFIFIIGGKACWLAALSPVGCSLCLRLALPVFLGVR